MLDISSSLWHTYPMVHAFFQCFLILSSGGEWPGGQAGARAWQRGYLPFSWKQQQELDIAHCNIVNYSPLAQLAQLAHSHVQPLAH